MKLVVFIPCLNEEKTLPLVLKSMPKKIDGVDEIEVVIVNDGSTDKTVEVAKKLGVKHFVHHHRNKGLAYSFRDGLDKSLELGADVIVITDGDNQHPQERMPDLVRPIVEGKADVVIADRQIGTVEYFSPFKKFLQTFGTRVLNIAAGTDVPDGTSGFRAFSREAAMQLNLVTRYSFGMETIIQAGNKRQAIETIVIKANPQTRESRLIKSSLHHTRKSAVAIMRAFVMYKPYTVFFTIGVILLIAGLIPFLHYFYLLLTTKSPFGAHHLQWLIIGSVLLVASFISFTLGIIADLIRMNRSLLEDVLELQRKARPNSDD